MYFPEKESFDFENDAIDNDNDPRHKINFFIEKLNKNFRKYYKPGKNITIDESLVHFIGKNNMKFYIPMKPHKWGLKFIYYVIPKHITYIICISILEKKESI